MNLPKLFLLLIPIFFLSSCLNDYDKRARLDLKVGILENEWSSWQVVAGLAQIKEDSDTNTITLWAQAPAFEIELKTGSIQTAPTPLQLICRNCLATSQLMFISSSDSTPLIDQIPRTAPTEKQWNITNLQPDSQYILQIGETQAGSELAYKVAFFSDIQKEGMQNVEDIFENINNYGDIKFVISAGDITHRGTSEEIEVFKEKLKSLQIPFYTTSGNHDVGWGEELAWQKYFGRNSFNFIYRNTAFSFVDSADATVAPKVYSWLEKWLEQSLDRVHIFIAHISPLDPVSSRQGSFSSRLEAHKLIGKLERAKVDLALFGHIHSYYSYSLGTIPAYISGGGGGNEEKLDGISRHYLVLNINSQQVKGIELVRIP